MFAMMLYFAHLLLNQKGQFTPNLAGSIQNGHYLENLFCACSHEPKGQLTGNLVGSIRMTCRSKEAKIGLMGNPRWPSWLPS